MDLFVFVGVGLFFTILFWAAMKLNKEREMQSWNHKEEEQTHEPKPQRF
jgi:hypothetical protein